MDFFVQNCPQLFETAFLMLLSSGAKMENFTFMQQMNENQDEGVQAQFNAALEVVLNISAQMIKMNLKNPEEMRLVLEDLGIQGDNLKAVIKTYQEHYIKRITNINTAYEETEDAGA